MSPSDPRGRYQHEITVADVDIDEFGHVNNAVYLQYVEAVGRRHSEREGLTVEVFRAYGVVPIVRRHVISYLRPAGPGDRLLVSTRVVKLGGPKAERHNQIRLAATDELLVDVLTQWVWLDPVTGRPKRAPAQVIEAFGWTG